MSLTITNLRVDFRSTEGWFREDPTDCPYLIVNCCFRITPDDESFAWARAKAESEEYTQVLTIDDPKRYEAWITREKWDFFSNYDGYGRAWTHNDAPWYYIEKFDTFWFRGWIADSSVTRAILSELKYYKNHGSLPSVYRSMEDGIILQHLQTLGRYWD